MDTPKKAKGGRKNRKVGRSKTVCQAYRSSHRREHNKAKRLRKHLLKCPNDACGRVALERCYLVIRPSAG